MEMPDSDEKAFARVLSAKQAVMQSAFTTTARLRDGLLRPANDDGMAKVLAAMKKASGEDDVDIFA